ncbi:RanBP1 domain [Popillia japonica]|uniref:RanBP1 domain n=1 Tax=Popillia japonica TaxID=7064 RepID=A0AAW1LWC3_POPJA
MSEANEAGDRNRSVSESSETEYDPHFSPIISLPEVAIITNEEDEEVMLKLRAKLYRFDTKSDVTPEWKERGTGEMKMLKHKGNNTVRIVMRRDKTLKVCANHFITPYMELKPSIGSSKAFVYTVTGDFADEEIKSECLAIRFGTVDFANQFKEKFEEGKKFVIENCKLYTDELDSSLEKGSDEDENDNPDGTDLTKKLSELDVNKKQTNED